MSTPTPCTNGIKVSADILGNGIRINLYFTMLLLPIIPRTPNTEELLNSLYQNAGITGFALLFTAIIQTGLNELSLFEALFILHILFFLGIGASPMGKYHWTRGRVFIGVLVQFVSVITFTAWGLYVWFNANIKHFGNENARSICNDRIKYVVFFVNIRATAPWLRGIWITALVLSAVGLMLTFGWKAMELFETKLMAEEQEAEEADAIARREVIVTPGTVSHVETKTEEPEKEWYFDISFTLLFSAIYSTIMLELMVHRNHKSGLIQFDGPNWAFGQVLSVVMILANLKEILHFFFGFLARRKLKLARDRRQAQTEEIVLRPEGHSAPTFHRSRGPSGSNVSSEDSCMS
ncbi:hypothetical protein BGY98DRAFT_949975 [Russula aff. rugulosa BPL654]|nr:hypothetical protein BGY98DRAFT_949975 [Russula aff. rugulosa BPL654]